MEMLASRTQFLCEGRGVWNTSCGKSGKQLAGTASAPSQLSSLLSMRCGGGMLHLSNLRGACLQKKERNHLSVNTALDGGPVAMASSSSRARSHFSAHIPLQIYNTSQLLYGLFLSSSTVFVSSGRSIYCPPLTGNLLSM